MTVNIGIYLGKVVIGLLTMILLIKIKSILIPGFNVGQHPYQVGNKRTTGLL